MLSAPLVSSPAAVLLLLAMTAVPAQGRDPIRLPPLDLGGSNVNDGIAYPGWFVQNITSLYRSERSYDADGVRSAADTDATVAASVLQIAWMSERTVLGAHPGVEVLFPFSWADVTIDPDLQADGSGLGDLILGGYLQWRPDAMQGRKRYLRLALTATLPTGESEADALVNPGAGHWSLSPYLAATWILSDTWEASGRLYWTLNGTRDARAPRELAARAGDSFSVNLGASREIVPGLRISLAGYAVEQVEDDTLDGRAAIDSRERVVALGGGVARRWGSEELVVHVFREFDARNRSAGTRLVLRYNIGF